MIRIDLGCGKFKKDGYIGVDWSDDQDVDIKCDLSKGIPFKDNEVDEIYTSHFLEHMKDDDMVAFIIKEISRVLKPSGKLTVIVPYWSCWEAQTLWGHKVWFSEHSFQTSYDFDKYFNIDKIEYIYKEPWKDKTYEEKEYARNHYLNVVFVISVYFTRK